MSRSVTGSVALLFGLTFLWSALGQEKKPADVFTDPKAAGPDFAVQGEYIGEVPGKAKYGVQVVALGDGKFDAYLLTGGLPGEGWDGKTRVKASAKTADGKTVITGPWTGEIAEGALTAKAPDGDEIAARKVSRKSPTLGEGPPTGAAVLFDGKNADHWSNGKLVEENLLYRGTASKTGFAAGRLHIEFRTPFQPKARGQGRGNSGVFVHGREVQVLDSFGLNGEKDECGAVYGSAKPLVNMCLPPLAWQTYDIEAKPGKEGELLLTVWHNGVKVQEAFPIKGSADKPASVQLQDHGNPVVYRNIWFVPVAK